ncbi:Thiamin pyrophosphokinase, catalytic domain containing protein [Tritrichomonas foetus]|uniref:Thiamin pyrophosphokinase, catalytic domain containing protein n=1 Tax=Tritrichomonas foetus TaxID=1144522 RepID=A0A1J4K0L6_9EUKA|nr:Thiamin pyrophosphokinase, catalytic domain containing protein [Tritrichomonas foetus]|eukprot:OHT04927.1 Thiamin pyrophosphokinase, catalytic domain containing protein [Tritrichomonas foetus]
MIFFALCNILRFSTVPFLNQNFIYFYFFSTFVCLFIQFLINKFYSKSFNSSQKMLEHPIESAKPYTALALNYYLPQFFVPLWNNAKTRFCADGGANKVFKMETEKKIDLKPPHAVVGDLDSIKDDTRKYYTSKGTEFIKIYDQDFNDIQKSLSTIAKSKLKEPVIVFGAWGGRFDHTMGSIHAALENRDIRTYFIDDNNFATWIYPEDKGIITKQEWTTKMCGLLPISVPVEKVTTKGLKWECDFGLRMGTFISASNEIAEGAKQVEIKTSHPILWQNQTKKLKDLPIK